MYQNELWSIFLLCVMSSKDSLCCTSKSTSNPMYPTANAQCPHVLGTLDSLQLLGTGKKKSQGAEEYFHSCLHNEGATDFSSQTSQK